MFTKLKNVLSKILRNHRHYNSALFIPGNKANENFAYINPCLDFDDRFSNLEKLQTNVSLRKLNINVNELQKVWDHYKYISSNKDNLEEKRVKITEQVNELLKKKNLVPEDEKRLTALKEQGKILKQDLKIIKEALWDLEENVITRALKLPNEIDENTPCENSLILKNVGAKTKFQGKCLSHLEIGKNLGLVDYKSPTCYYLQNDAVDFELGIMNLSGKILNSNNCIRISGVDFSRSIIIEGCGMNHENPMESFILKNTENAEKYLELNKLHLTGGASLPAFLAMLAKQLIRPKYFPLRFFATGRQYIPITDSNSSYGLFAANQASAVHAFFLTKNVDEYKLEFEKLVEIGLAIYKEIASHHRVVLRPALELKPWETMKVSFEMWSSYSEKYIEVGHVSAYSSYFSKRLLIAYQTPNGREFPYCISGTLLSVPKILACLLEENPEKFLVPEKILKLAF